MKLGLGLGNDVYGQSRGGVFGGLLLDQYSGAAAAYSLRKLSSDTTNVVRVRRSSDNAEQDFSPDEITDGTLATWVGGSNDGFVTTWYDQAGSNDATQATAAAQPKIVDAGVLVEENGRPSVDFDGVDDVLVFPASIGTPFSGQGKAISAFSVNSIVSGNVTLWSITGISNDDYYFSSYDGNKFRFFARGQSGDLKSSASSSNFGAGQYLKADILPEEVLSVQNGDMYIDDTQQVTSFDYVTNTKTLNRGGGIGALVRSSITGNFSGNHQEIVFYSSDQSANRTAIEDNINSYYNIY